jgi:hypothetical protein
MKKAWIVLLGLATMLLLWMNTDWTAARGIASLDVELTDHTHTELSMNLRVLNVLVTWRP